MEQSKLEHDFWAWFNNNAPAKIYEAVASGARVKSERAGKILAGKCFRFVEQFQHPDGSAVCTTAGGPLGAEYFVEPMIRIIPNR